MAKFIIDTTINNVSKAMLEMILEEHLDYNIYVKEIEPINKDKLYKLAKNYVKDYIESCKRLNCCYKTEEDVFMDGYLKAMEGKA